MANNENTTFDPNPGDCEESKKETATKWFHHLWTKAGMSPNYNKEPWRKVRDQLVEANIISS